MTLKGKLLWKAGGKEGTWTDGGAALGDKVVPWHAFAAFLQPLVRLRSMP